MKNSRLARSAILLAVASLLAAPLGAQTTIGFTPNADENNTQQIFASLSNSTGYILPFTFGATGIGGDYAISSVSLLLSGNASLADFSVSVSSTFSTDLAAPTALDTFTTTGTLTATPTAHTFSSAANTTLSQASTYYLRVVYSGSDTASWIRTSGNAYGIGGSTNYGGGVPSLTAAYNPGDQKIYYRTVTSGGFTDFGTSGTNMGVALTATAIPEPGTAAALAGAAALVVALVIRRRRSTAVDQED